ncbi:MAG: DHHW family protein, partial [Blautia sp.]|nr:DHHW family protein [Blautia sp.]
MENQRRQRKRKMTPEERQIRKQKLFYHRSSKIYIKMAGIFLVFLIVAFAFNLFSKDKKYSESENRMLAQKPVFSMANLTSGKYMKDMEDYVTDQFFIRDKWINLKVLEDLALGKKESNGVYIGKKDYLMEIPTAPNQKALDNNLDAISNFSASHPDINTVMTLIPNAAYIYDHLIPRNAPVRDQEKDIKYVMNAVSTSLNFVDLTKTMSSHKEEDIYYKTDHHWTTLGARYAFDALSTALGIEKPTQEYKIYPVTHSFQGTLASKSGYDKALDTIEIYVPQGVNTDCVVNFTDEGKKTASVYESAALEKKDKYEVFFGGNHTRIDISTPMEGKKNLLLFKDSYANCFIPFLVPYYRNIIVIDPRYFYDDIESLISDNEI